MDFAFTVEKSAMLYQCVLRVRPKQKTRLITWPRDADEPYYHRHHLPRSHPAPGHLLLVPTDSASPGAHRFRCRRQLYWQYHCESGSHPHTPPPCTKGGFSLWMADSSPNTHRTAPLSLLLSGSYSEKIQLLVIPSPQSPIVLGLVLSGEGRHGALH